MENDDATIVRRAVSGNSEFLRASIGRFVKMSEEYEATSGIIIAMDESQAELIKDIVAGYRAERDAIEMTGETPA